MLIEVIIWGVIIFVVLAGVIWAIVSRIKREKNEDQYDHRDN